MTLTTLNVWLDVVFMTLYPIMVIALIGHFTGNILTGRAKRRFGKQWEWPHHDSHPPFLPKFLHFTHVASMIALGASGFLIRFPQFDRSPMRVLHYVFMVIVIVNLVWRLWYAFGSRQRDYREFVIDKRDIVTAPKVILYYIFVKKSKPHLGKYNVMQKGTYTLFVPLLIVQAITGLMLFRVGIPMTDTSLYGLSAGVIGATGIFWIRTIHYVVNWLFIILTTIHVYLSVTEDFPAFLDFFGLGAFDPNNRHGGDHGDHDHDDEHGHADEPAPAYAVVDHG
jgi:Ni/Fe-hydrogenase 1 B-type cytochrome subunit